MSERRRSSILIVMAISAVSSSAVLARWADAPPEALAFWRTLGGALALAPVAGWRGQRSGRTPLLAVSVAGVALAVHFSTWLASLELTSVAASVTLVTTTPLLLAVGWALAGRRPPLQTWLAIGVALVGVTIIATGGAPEAGTGVDRPAPVLGAVLALVGAAAMAVYLAAGDRVRATLSTAAYAARAYAVAAVGLAVYATATGVSLTGYDRRTWLAIGAMILGPQLAGHTVLNLLLRRLGSVTVSTLLLVEPVAAALLVWLLLDEAPPLAAWIGGPLVVAAVALQLRASPTTPTVTDAGRPDVETLGPGG